MESLSEIISHLLEQNKNILERNIADSKKIEEAKKKKTELEEYNQLLLNKIHIRSKWKSGNVTDPLAITNFASSVFDKCKSSLFAYLKDMEAEMQVVVDRNTKRLLFYEKLVSTLKANDDINYLFTAAVMMLIFNNFERESFSSNGFNVLNNSFAVRKKRYDFAHDNITTSPNDLYLKDENFKKWADSKISLISEELFNNDKKETKKCKPRLIECLMHIFIYHRIVHSIGITAHLIWFSYGDNVDSNFIDLTYDNSIKEEDYLVTYTLFPGIYIDNMVLFKANALLHLK